MVDGRGQGFKMNVLEFFEGEDENFELEQHSRYVVQDAELTVLCLSSAEER